LVTFSFCKGSRAALFKLFIQAGKGDSPISSRRSAGDVITGKYPVIVVTSDSRYSEIMLLSQLVQYTINSLSEAVTPVMFSNRAKNLAKALMRCSPTAVFSSSSFLSCVVFSNLISSFTQKFKGAVLAETSERAGDDAVLDAASEPVGGDAAASSAAVEGSAPSTNSYRFTRCPKFARLSTPRSNSCTIFWYLIRLYFF
jgi:hypothetical protein